jgi:hypothetical protein
MERARYTVKSAGVPLFPNVSNINIFEHRQPRFGTIQLNDIIPECECEFIGCFDECQSLAFLINIIDHWFARGHLQCSFNCISEQC